ncbi:restriction endonuclease subunit S [Evansella halocellulosilytica]|uniref:restriction endonuclease subunit S n=1 Tax=Evansella halocellulosilytica TaxID=2011013 RepID=UPI000BB96B89|nr:restriction endonuclease subunit S [Evansella halocellulosilytica]
MKTPELRFKNYKDNWKLSYLNQLCEINPKSGDLPWEFIYISLECVKQGELLSQNILEKHNAPSRAKRVLELGDVLFQSVRSYQKNHYILSEEFTLPTVASTGFSLLRAKEDERFLYHLLFTSRFSHEVKIRSTGSNYPAINGSDLSDVEVSYPSTSEQQKIGEFFTLLDERIKKQHEKVGLLKEQKKGLLQKIFNQELRFMNDEGKEFQKWKRVQLSEVASKVKEKNKSLVTNVISNSALYGLIKQKDYFDKDIANASNIAGYYVIKEGDLVYNPRISKEAPYGPVSVYPFPEAGVVSPLYLCFRVNNNSVNSRFLHYYFKSSQWHKHIYTHGDKGARHDRVSIKDVDFFKLQINLPVEKEQNKIAKVLDLFEKKEIMEKEKLRSLHDQKKGFLQQVFI